MSTPEPSFAVPLSKLVEFDPDSDRVWWCCATEPQNGCDADGHAPSESEARSAAIAHLATVHGITALVEEKREAADIAGRERQGELT